MEESEYVGPLRLRKASHQLAADRARQCLTGTGASPQYSGAHPVLIPFAKCDISTCPVRSINGGSARRLYPV